MACVKPRELTVPSGQKLLQALVIQVLQPSLLISLTEQAPPATFSLAAMALALRCVEAFVQQHLRIISCQSVSLAFVFCTR